MKRLYAEWLGFQALNKSLERKVGISITQMMLFECALRNPGISLHRLSQALRLHPSSLTPLVARLERKKLIFIESDPWDRRKRILNLARPGKEKLERALEELKVLE